jgi:hypothetical protein
MPRGDRTGPMGFGPITGRGAGYCGGFGEQGFMNPAGRRGGRGWRHWYCATGLPGWARAGSGLPTWGAPLAPLLLASVSPQATPGAEMAALKAYAAHLEQTLHSLRQRIQNLEGTAKSE